MPRRLNGFIAHALVAGAAALGFASVSIMCAQPVLAAAYAPSQQLSAQTITQFTNNPSRMLTQFPTGGGQMISRVRDLLASDPAVLVPILTLVANANSDQKSAMGAALAQAAKLYARSDQAFAAQIQQAVANTQDQELIVAYAAAAGDQPIAATGVGVSGGSVGGPTGPLGGPTGGTGPAQQIGANGVDTGQFSLTGGLVAGSGGGGGTNAANNLASNSVSP